MDAPLIYAYHLAAGEYGFDLQTTYTNIAVDQRVDSAVRFSVDACSPDGIAYNFRQDLGAGHLAMRLTGPLDVHFVPIIFHDRIFSSIFPAQLFCPIR